MTMTTEDTPSPETTGLDKTGEQKRAELQSKIDAAQARNEGKALADYAREARDEATSFVKEHPVATVLGGLALGAVVAAVVPGPGRRLRKKASKRGAVMAGLVAELAATYGSKFLDEVTDLARAGQNGLEDIGDAIVDKSRGAKNEAGFLAQAASNTAQALKRNAGKKASRATRAIRSRLPD